MWRWQYQEVIMISKNCAQGYFYVTLFILKLQASFKPVFILGVWNENSISKRPNKKILQFVWLMKYKKQKLKICISWSNFFTILITLNTMAHLSKSKLLYINHWFCCSAYMLLVTHYFAYSCFVLFFIRYVLYKAECAWEYTLPFYNTAVLGVWNRPH